MDANQFKEFMDMMVQNFFKPINQRCKDPSIREKLIQATEQMAEIAAEVTACEPSKIDTEKITQPHASATLFDVQKVGKQTSRPRQRSLSKSANQPTPRLHKASLSRKRYQCTQEPRRFKQNAKRSYSKNKDQAIINKNDTSKVRKNSKSRTRTCLSRKRNQPHRCTQNNNLKFRLKQTPSLQQRSFSRNQLRRFDQIDNLKFRRKSKSRMDNILPAAGFQKDHRYRATHLKWGRTPKKRKLFQ